MTELMPLLSSSTDDFERALLQSAESDDIGAAALLKTASLFGVGASAVLPTIVASHVAVGGAPAVLWPIVLKWLGLGVFCGVALSGVASLVTANAPRAVESELAPSVAHPQPMRSLSRATPDEGTPEPYPTAQNAAPAAPRRSAPSALPEPRSAEVPAPDSPSVAAFASAATPAAAESIADQIQAIERARQALAASRAMDALSAISSYRARWPSGELTPEAIVLGVRAKKMLGDSAGAERDALALIARDPDSRYAVQLRALLGIPRSQ